jgi:ribosomal-protein-alanine N-acetyltransferase
MTREKVRCETERLILRQFTANDAEAFHNNVISDPEVCRYTHFEPSKTIDDTLKRIKDWIANFDSVESGLWNYFAITLKGSGELIGTIDYAVTDSEAKAAEVGYHLGRKWWRQGYASEALSELLRYLFEDVKLNRVWACHDARNPNSGGVMRKCGMRCEGTMRQCRVRKGELTDRVNYAILAEDYFKPQDKNVVKITNPADKTGICRSILGSLPEWFGIQSSIDEYCKAVRAEPMFAAFDGDSPIGFIAIKERNSHTAEIDVMGILPGYHRRGIGRGLIASAERLCAEQGHSFLLVKTLDSSSNYEPYARTREFYLAMGFEPQQSLTGYWNEENPCLLMSKRL